MKKQHYSQEEMHEILKEAPICPNDRETILNIIKLLPFHSLKELGQAITKISKGKK